MDVRPEHEGTRVAKKQKTFYLNPELDRLIEALCETRGTSFTKIVTAALIQYLLSSIDGPAPAWMRLAVALEKGDATLTDVVRAIAQDEIRKLDFSYELRKEQHKPGVSYPGTEFEHTHRTGAWKYWIEVVEQAQKDGADPLQAFIRAYTHWPTVKVIHPPPPDKE